MFHMNLGNWAWDWGWGWAATVGGILLVGILLVPWFFFLLNLHNLLDRVREQNRAMPPSYVWLNFIPLFNLGWFIYTVLKVRDSVRAEYESRHWEPEGDFGYNVGIAAGVLWIASFFFWWIPLIGWLLGIGWLVCWIIYWLKTSDLKKRLEEGAAWTGATPSTRYPASTPPYSTPARPYSGPAPPVAPAPFASGSTAPAAEAASAASTPRGPAPAVAATEATSAAAASEEVRSRLCIVCGASYDQGDKFCRSCGLPLP